MIAIKTYTLPSLPSISVFWFLHCHSVTCSVRQLPWWGWRVGPPLLCPALPHTCAQKLRWEMVASRMRLGCSAWGDAPPRRSPRWVAPTSSHRPWRSTACHGGGAATLCPHASGTRHCISFPLVFPTPAPHHGWCWRGRYRGVVAERWSGGGDAAREERFGRWRKGRRRERTYSPGREDDEIEGLMGPLQRCSASLASAGSPPAYRRSLLQPSSPSPPIVEAPSTALLRSPQRADKRVVVGLWLRPPLAMGGWGRASRRPTSEAAGMDAGGSSNTEGVSCAQREAGPHVILTKVSCLTE
jgi:hypothetical protein